jgi:hypothetical protein
MRLDTGACCVVLLSLAAASCRHAGSLGTDLKIVDGEPVGPTEYLSVVPIDIRADVQDESCAWSVRDVINCTGTLVASTTVLTAAHCVEGAYMPRVGGAAPTLIVKSARYRRASDDAIDLALLSFATPPVGDAPVSPIGAAAPREKTDRITLVGFGCDDLQARSGAGVKRKGDNFVESKRAADSAFVPGEAFVVKRSLFAEGDAAKANAVACPGDSGGPMLFDGAVVAVTSTAYDSTLGSTHTALTTDFASQLLAEARGAGVALPPGPVAASQKWIDALSGDALPKADAVLQMPREGCAGR